VHIPFEHEHGFGAEVSEAGPGRYTDRRLASRFVKRLGTPDRLIATVGRNMLGKSNGDADMRQLGA